jgi:hypothetical protein
MDNAIDQKIKSILKDLGIAHSKSEKFNATKPLDPYEVRKATDIYDMALAYENEERILLQLELAYSEKYPANYSSEQILKIEEEIQRLTRRIHAWQNRQFPSQYKD